MRGCLLPLVIRSFARDHVCDDLIVMTNRLSIPEYFDMKIIVYVDSNPFAYGKIFAAINAAIGSDVEAIGQPACLTDTTYYHASKSDKLGYKSIKYLTTMLDEAAA